MSIRAKIVLIVLPLIVTPLLLTGVISSLSARNGITQIATEFLRFKIEELHNYASSQWALLRENNMTSNSEFVEASKAAVQSFAESLVRSPTELILAVDGSGNVVLKTGDVDILPDETVEIARILSETLSGWKQIKLNGEDRVSQVSRFAPYGWTIFVTEKRDTFYRIVNQIYWQTGLILSLATILSIVLLLMFARFLTRPLRNIVGAMKDIISTTDLTKRVEVLYKDETGELGHTFNIMTGELGKAYEQVKGYALQAVIAQHKEQKIRNIFQKYVPKDVIDQFFTNPEGMLVGEDRILALLFSDIRSFTTISEKMLPSEVVESLNNYFGLMVDIIMQHRGIVDKYMGDAIMAFFGAPVRHGDEAIQAVRSGLDMHEALNDFNVWQTRRNRPRFRIGIGINYGAVTVGNIGSEKKMDYTVIGDMVNLASRMEGLTKYYKEPMIISEAVYRQVQQELPCRLLDIVVVKGRTRGVGVYTPRKMLPPRETQAWKLHGEALELYYAREFEDASRRFEQVQEIIPEDRAAHRFLQHCRAHIKSPPPADWNGAVLMEEK